MSFKSCLTGPRFVRRPWSIYKLGKWDIIKHQHSGQIWPKAAWDTDLEGSALTQLRVNWAKIMLLRRMYHTTSGWKGNVMLLPTQKQSDDVGRCFQPIRGGGTLFTVTWNLSQIKAPITILTWRIRKVTLKETEICNFPSQIPQDSGGKQDIKTSNGLTGTCIWSCGALTLISPLVTFPCVQA